MFTDKLKKIIEATVYSMRQFAKELGISPSTFHEYLKGRTPPADLLVRICERFNVSETWLLTGEGPMFREKEVRKEEEPPPSREDSSEGLSPELLRALSHPTIRSIALMLSEMSEDDIREILKRVEEKKLLKFLLKKVQELDEKAA
jgi:transcriptional regulator with XRE-family HTH domain